MTLLLTTLLLLGATNYITQERMRYKKTIFYTALAIQILAYLGLGGLIPFDWLEKSLPGIAGSGIYLVLMCNIIENIRPEHLGRKIGSGQ